MKIDTFRHHKIKRSCSAHYTNYRSYKDNLMKDFSQRCCYCNVSQKIIMQNFQIDHFIPKKVFKGTRDELLCEYDNLILTCPKCNRAKSDKYEGTISNSGIHNDLFYNPDEIDYNEIFFRNELGGIDSDDEKGKSMIRLLRLYRPLHNLEWVFEKIDNLCNILDEQLENDEISDSERENLKNIQLELLRIYRKADHFLKATYIADTKVIR